MAKIAPIACLLLLVAVPASAHKGVIPMRRAGLAGIPMRLHAEDCWKRSKVSATAALQIPGAGMEPEKLTPFDTIYKDGFYLVACVRDMLYEFGDKFGDGKYSYNIGDVSNVSIVHYAKHVAKEDRKTMTPEVCFDFCRSVPDMLFFGLTKGRECYCMPYYKPMESDSSGCDAVCTGDNTQMCGGMTKSSVFGMHQCADTAADVTQTLGEMTIAEQALMEVEGKVSAAAFAMQEDATTFQTTFGNAGDPGASDLMQQAKAFAGELTSASKDAMAIMQSIGEAHAMFDQGKSMDFTKLENVRNAEALDKSMEGLITKAEGAAEELAALSQLATPEVGNATGAVAQYYPLMYFVNKKFEDVPSTCSGAMLKKPIVGKSMDECAKACDAEVKECVGFSFFEGKLCFLFSKFESITYYTGCKTASMFLQKKRQPASVSCVGKLEDFEGKSVKPDPSGKCGTCLKEATEAARCY